MTELERELLAALKRIVDAPYSEQIDAITAAMPLIAKVEAQQKADDEEWHKAHAR